MTKTSSSVYNVSPVPTLLMHVRTCVPIKRIKCNVKRDTHWRQKWKRDAVLRYTVPLIGSVTASSIRVHRYTDDIRDDLFFSLSLSFRRHTDIRASIVVKHMFGFFFGPRLLFHLIFCFCSYLKRIRCITLPGCNIFVFRVACLYLWTIIFDVIPVISFRTYTHIFTSHHRWSLITPVGASRLSFSFHNRAPPHVK